MAKMEEYYKSLENDEKTSSTSIVKILERYNKPLPVDFIATQLSSSSTEVLLKLKDLQDAKIVTLDGNMVNLNIRR